MSVSEGYRVEEYVLVPKSPSLTTGEGPSIFETRMLFGLTSNRLVAIDLLEVDYSPV